MRTTTEREPLPSGVPLTKDNVDPTVAAIAAAGQLADWIKGLLNPTTVAGSLGGVFALPGGVGGFVNSLGGPTELSLLFQRQLTGTSTIQQVCGALRSVAK